MSFLKKIFRKVSKTENVETKIIATHESNQNSFVRGLETDKEKNEDYLAKELKQKFFRNLELMVEYDILIDSYCDIFETWEDVPIGSKLSYVEIHTKIKQILELEFSEDMCEKVKNGLINCDEIENMISKLDADYLLYKPQCDYTQKKEDDLLDKFKDANV